jgi:hypothetical protein
VKGLGGPTAPKIPPAQSSKLNNAMKQVVIKTAQKEAKKAKKKKGFSWKSLLGTAAKEAISLAPELIGAMMLNHGPTKTALAQAPVGSVPLAASDGDISQLTGLRQLSVVKRDSRGRVARVRVVTMDFLKSIDSSAYSQGDKIYEAWVSPLDPAFEGTKFAEFGSQYERYEVKHACFIYQPTCAATTSGALMGCVFADPEIDVDSFGATESIRVIGSQLGSETWQPWAMGMFSVPIIKRDDLLYTDPDGTDIRFVVAGKALIACAADLAGGVTPGNLFFCAEVEYDIPTLSEGAGAGASAYLKDNTGSAPGGIGFTPISVLNIDRQYLGQGAVFLRTGSWYESGTLRSGNVLKGLGAGDWQITGMMAGSGISQAITVVIPDEAVTYGVTTNQQQLNADVGIISSGNSGALSSTILSLPSGLPAGLVVAGFRFNATTINLSSIVVAKIDDALFTSDDPMLAKRRSNFYAKTAQGQQAAQRARIAQMERTLRQLTTPSAPALTSPEPATIRGPARW